MDKKFLKMVFEAPELQPLIKDLPGTIWCDGYHTYVKYPVHDEFTGEDETGAWCWSDWFREPLWKPEEIKIPRQEDLEEIFLTHLGPCNPFKKYPMSILPGFAHFVDKTFATSEWDKMNSISECWLVYTMKEVFKKEWDSEKGKWMVIDD